MSPQQNNCYNVLRNMVARHMGSRQVERGVNSIRALYRADSVSVLTIMPMLLQRLSASSMLCVVRITEHSLSVVVIRLMISHMNRLAMGSIPVDGSCEKGQGYCRSRVSACFDRFASVPAPGLCPCPPLVRGNKPYCRHDSNQSETACTLDGHDGVTQHKTSQYLSSQGLVRADLHMHVKFD